MSERASGWYDDPQNPDQLRYWDGILWSDRTMPKVNPNLEQSRIGDARRQYEEEQERRRAAEQAQNPGHGQRPQLRPYQQQSSQQYPGGPGPYAYQQPHQQPVKAAPDGEPTAEWWRRLVAYLVDRFLLWVVSVALSWHWLHPWVRSITDWWSDAFTAAENHQAQPPLPDAVYHFPWQYPLIGLVLYLAYEITLVAWRGQTLGHLLCGIRVRGAASTAKPDLRATAIRSVVKGADVLLSLVQVASALAKLFVLVDGLVPLGDKRAQSLHDMAAKTYVVNARKPATAPHGGQLPPSGGGR